MINMLNILRGMVPTDIDDWDDPFNDVVGDTTYRLTFDAVWGSSHSNKPEAYGVHFTSDFRFVLVGCGCDFSRFHDATTTGGFDINNG